MMSLCFEYKQNSVKRRVLNLLVMPIYLQKVPDKNFDAEGSFHVKDSKGCNLTMGLLFLAAFIITVYMDRFNTHSLSIYQLLYLAIIPGVYPLKTGMVNKTIITIKQKWILLF